MAAEEEYYIFTGGAVPRHVTRVCIDESITVIPARAFYRHQNITELNCHIGVKKVEEYAFHMCPSLWRVIIPGVKEVKTNSFRSCVALTGNNWRVYICWLQIFEMHQPAMRQDLEGSVFRYCKALTNVIFGKELETIGSYICISLERITIPLKDGMITRDNVFQGCGILKHVDLVGGEHDETITALLLEEWKNDMNEEIDSINQILPTTPAGNVYFQDVGGKAREVRLWIRSVLHKIIQYKAQHQSYLDEAATTLQLALPNDIVSRNVLPFLELPSYTFEGED
eukprot:scaffold8973_cov75-Skeletonema_dohrnii-CCMP3373.AAC.3